MTGYADIESCVLGMKAGAADFLLKPCNEDQLLEAVDRALAQSARVYALIAEKRAIEDQLSSLTPRETEVFWLVVRGLLNKQIAGRLGTKEGTVKLHRANVMRKLDAQSVADLVRLADRLAQDSAPAEDPSPNGSIPAAEYARIAAGSR
jgi:FixJ family two-component response regulator